MELTLVSKLKNRKMIGVNEVMGGKFIYACTESAKDKLLAEGYTLLTSNETKNIFVFENKPEMCFALNESEYVFSDTLTF